MSFKEANTTFRFKTTVSQFNLYIHKTCNIGNNIIRRSYIVYWSFPLCDPEIEWNVWKIACKVEFKLEIRCWNLKTAVGYVALESVKFISIMYRGKRIENDAPPDPHMPLTKKIYICPLESWNLKIEALCDSCWDVTVTRPMHWKGFWLDKLKYT